MITLQPNDHSQVLPPPAAETRSVLAGMLDELPDPYATVLTRVELDGLSFADSAASMGMGESSVRLIYREGRRRLREVVMAHSETDRL